MAKLSYYIDNDWFKIGRYGEKHVRNINIALLGSYKFTNSNFINFPDFSDILHHNLFLNKFRIARYSHRLRERKFTFIQNYDSVENSEFEKINIAMKIMPSYNTEKNALIMKHSNDIYKSSIPNSLALMESFNMNNTFFFINQTSFFFPKLMYFKDNIPVGDSISMCLAVSWAPKERGFNYDIMKPVTGFPECKEASTGKFIWNSDDPLNGIDVPVWRQKVMEVDCTNEEDCDSLCTSYNSVYIGGRNTKRCYSYEVLETICFLIEYDELKEEYKFAGGCFKDNLHYLMSTATKQREFEFDGIEIEVRNKKDPIIKAGELSNYSFSFGESWNFIAVLLNILIILSLIGLGVVAYFIYKYKNQQNSSSLLSEKKESPIDGLDKEQIEKEVKKTNQV